MQCAGALAPAHALGTEAWRKPRWRTSGRLAAVGALSVSERGVWEGVVENSRSPPWPDIGTSEAIIMMKVGVGVLPRSPFAVPAGIPARCYPLPFGS